MSEHLPVLFCVGSNHESAALDVRESLYLSPEELDTAIPKLIEKHHIKEVMVLSTCNRLELYGVVNREEVTKSHLSEIFADLQTLSGKEFPETLSLEADQHSYSYTNTSAAEHAFSVAAGLDSLVLGETQITGQFKDSFAHFSDKGLMGPILKRMAQEAFSSSKKDRTQTDISKRPVSISHAAIDLANRVYGHIKDYRVLIIGAGEMAEVAAKYAIKYNPKELHVVNRTLKNAEKLVESLGEGKAYSWENLYDLLPVCDVVISSTSAHDYILSKENLVRSQQKRDNQPTFIVDIALPRDIDPDCSDLDDVYLFDIDDLKQVVGENFEERRKAADVGKGLVKQNAENFFIWMNSQNLKPALAGFRGYLDTLFNQEMQKSLKKGPLSDLSEDQIKAISSMLNSISNKINGDAGRHIRKPPESIYAEDLASALTILFPQQKRKP